MVFRWGGVYPQHHIAPVQNQRTSPVKACTRMPSARMVTATSMLDRNDSISEVSKHLVMFPPRGGWGLGVGLWVDNRFSLPDGFLDVCFNSIWSVVEHNYSNIYNLIIH